MLVRPPKSNRHHYPDTFRSSDRPLGKFEQASKFEVIIDAEIARTLGVELPPSLLLRAGEVLE